MFVLTSQDESGRDNACIINTAFQVSSNPFRIAISSQDHNLTREIIEKTGKFNISVLDKNVPFETIKRFGFQSGRDVDKLNGYKNVKRSANGLVYITENTNAYFSVKVDNSINLGSHTLFVGEVSEAINLSKEESCTYAYYHKAIKK